MKNVNNTNWRRSNAQRLVELQEKKKTQIHFRSQAGLA